MKLGSPIEISSTVQNSSTPDEYAPYRAFMRQQGGLAGEPQPDEAVSPDAGDLAYIVTISASFALDP
jgi:hypothetical protein